MDVGAAVPIFVAGDFGATGHANVAELDTGLQVRDVLWTRITWTVGGALPNAAFALVALGILVGDQVSACLCLADVSRGAGDDAGVVGG